MHEDDAMSMTWMTKDWKLNATLKEFGELLGYEDKGELIPSGWRRHGNNLSSHRDVLEPITMEGGINGKTAHICRPFEILHRVYREIIAPHVGKWDEVHGFMIDIFKNSSKM